MNGLSTVSKDTVDRQQARWFSARVLKWFAQHGRKNLPWQQNADAYRVWVSEIMLQQTQVATVIPFYNAFMESFPTVASLCAASQDQVLNHWSGLGYYARARNLHRTAGIIVVQYDGQFPCDVDSLEALPGIGRSTAGAIVSLAFGRPAAILDGNVKRVLSRFHALDGWPGSTANHKRLWAVSEMLTPKKSTDLYNQAMMDLGATVCTRSSPACDRCPLRSRCTALASGAPTQWPHKKPRKVKPARTCWMLLAQDANQQLLMYRRAPSGLWGGLYSFLQFESYDDTLAAARTFGAFKPSAIRPLADVQHSFTHFDLLIHPLYIDMARLPSSGVTDAGSVQWYHARELPGGVPAPVTKLLKAVANLSG